MSNAGSSLYCIHLSGDRQYLLLTTSTPYFDLHVQDEVQIPGVSDCVHEELNVSFSKRTHVCTTPYQSGLILIKFNTPQCSQTHMCLTQEQADIL